MCEQRAIHMCEQRAIHTREQRAVSWPCSLPPSLFTHVCGEEGGEKVGECTRVDLSRQFEPIVLSGSFWPVV